MANLTGPGEATPGDNAGVSRGSGKSSNMSKLDTLLERLKTSADGSRETSPDPTSKAEDSCQASSSRGKKLTTLMDKINTSADHSRETSPDPASKDCQASSRRRSRKPAIIRKIVESEDEGSQSFMADMEEPAIPAVEIYPGTSADNGDIESVDIDELGNYILPEGTVVVEPEEVEEKEVPFRGPEFRCSRKKTGGDSENSIITCTACNKQVNQNISGAARRHPVLKVLICKKCYNYYTSDEIDQDSDGCDEQCRWCGEGGDLICCDYCHNAFCKRCIKRNLGRSALATLLEADDDAKWRCYVCDPKPLCSVVEKSNRIFKALEEADMVIKKQKQDKRRESLGKDSQHNVSFSSKGKQSGNTTPKNAPKKSHIVSPFAIVPGNDITDIPINHTNVTQVLDRLIAASQSMGTLLESLKDDLSGRSRNGPPPDLKHTKTEVAKKLKRAFTSFKLSLRDIENFSRNCQPKPRPVGHPVKHEHFVQAGKIRNASQLPQNLILTDRDGKKRPLFQYDGGHIKVKDPGIRQNTTDVIELSSSSDEETEQAKSQSKHNSNKDSSNNEVVESCSIGEKNTKKRSRESFESSDGKKTGRVDYKKLPKTPKIFHEADTSKKSFHLRISMGGRKSLVKNYTDDSDCDSINAEVKEKNRKPKSIRRESQNSDCESVKSQNLKADSSSGKGNIKLDVNLEGIDKDNQDEKSNQETDTVIHCKDEENEDMNVEAESENLMEDSKVDDGDGEPMECDVSIVQESAMEEEGKHRKKKRGLSGTGEIVEESENEMSKDGVNILPTSPDSCDSTKSDQENMMDKVDHRKKESNIRKRGSEDDEKGTDENDTGSVSLDQERETGENEDLENSSENKDNQREIDIPKTQKSGKDLEQNRNGKVHVCKDTKMENGMCDMGKKKKSSHKEDENRNDKLEGKSADKENLRVSNGDVNNEAIRPKTAREEETNIIQLDGAQTHHDGDNSSHDKSPRTSRRMKSTPKKVKLDSKPAQSRSRADIEAQRQLHKEFLEDDTDDDVADDDDDSSDILDSNGSSEEQKSSGDEYDPDEDKWKSRRDLLKKKSSDKWKNFRAVKKGKMKQISDDSRQHSKKRISSQKSQQRKTEESDSDFASKKNSKRGKKYEKDSESTSDSMTKNGKTSKKKSKSRGKNDTDEDTLEDYMDCMEENSPKQKNKGKNAKETCDSDSESEEPVYSRKKKTKHNSDSKAEKTKRKRSSELNQKGSAKLKANQHNSDSSDSDDLDQEIKKLSRTPKIEKKNKGEHTNHMDSSEESSATSESIQRNNQVTSKKAGSKDGKARKALFESVEDSTADDCSQEENIKDSEDTQDSLPKEKGKKKKKSNDGKKRTQVDDIVSGSSGEEAAMEPEKEDSDTEEDSTTNKSPKKNMDKEVNADSNARKDLLAFDSSTDEQKEDINDSDKDSAEDIVKKKSKTKGSAKNKSKKNDDFDSDFESDGATKHEKKKKKRDKLLAVSLSESDSDIGRKKKKKKKSRDKSSGEEISSDTSIETPKKKRGKGGKRKKKSSSDSESESDSDFDKKKKAKKRKRIKAASDSSAADDSEDDDNTELTPGSKKRKKIRKIIKDKKLADETKEARKAEEERRKRIKERQKLYNQVVEEDENAPDKCPRTTKLVLEVGEDEDPVIEVSSKLICRLKPHQVEAVKFLWECCVESLKRLKKEEGSGCILAHCMGLGKTLSVITFIHTLLSNKRKTKMKTCLVVCPLNVTLNWENELQKWFDDEKDMLDIYEMSTVKNNWGRADYLQQWIGGGGVMILGYEMYRNMTQHRYIKSKKMKKIFTECLCDPGPDLVVCDEGHILKNDASGIAKAMNQISTKRRIVLTGTPLQNNLIEYHCMVNFVKPNLLGSRKEFGNRFVNPITNGQCSDSTPQDVKTMKRRAHVLHETLAGCVQRKDYSALTKFLPPKLEYVILIRMTPVQIKLYEQYLTNVGAGPGEVSSAGNKGARLFKDFQNLMKIWTHPWMLKLDEIRQENKRTFDYSEDSFVDDSDDEASMSTHSDDSMGEVSADPDEWVPRKRRTRGRKSPSDEELAKPGTSSGKRGSDSENEVVRPWKSRRRRGDDASSEDEQKKDEVEKTDGKVSDEWWAEHVKEGDHFNAELSGKLMLMAALLKMAESIGDKVLVFSQSLLSLDLIEEFLDFWDKESQEKPDPDSIGGGLSWVKGADYFRMDGSTNAQLRSRWSDVFNDPENTRGRLFLISTKAGSLGINMVSANRVIIFDASWNPSHDIQSIFRVYRFGQTKPSYIYRFLAQGTMEEKIYERQVTKQSLSQRVVDEHQIERHFTQADMQELYSFRPDRLDDPDKPERPTPMLPKDRLLADLLQNQKDVIVTYHEHDSLLENKEEESLTEEERKAAWEDYEQEKKGLRMPPPQNWGAMLNSMQLQQQNPQAAMFSQQGNYPQMIQVARALLLANPTMNQAELQARVNHYLQMTHLHSQNMYGAYQQPTMFNNQQELARLNQMEMSAHQKLRQMEVERLQRQQENERLQQQLVQQQMVQQMADAGKGEVLSSLLANRSKEAAAANAASPPIGTPSSSAVADK